MSTTDKRIQPGERVGFIRKGRGLGQVQLAMRAGLSVDALQSIEQGRRTPSVRTLQTLADVLGVNVLLLRGQDPAAPGGVAHPGVGALYDALLGLTARREEATPSIEEMRQRVDLVGSLWFGSSDYDATARELPKAVEDIERLRGTHSSPAESEQRREIARLAFGVYSTVRHFSKAAGAHEVAVLARERALVAAEATDDPLYLGASQWSLSLQLVHEGHLDGAETVVRRTMERPELRDSPNPTARSLVGMLLASRSIASARRGNLEVALRTAEEARPIAEATGDTNVFWSAWGPTNLGIYITEIEAEHGRPHEGLRTAELLVSEHGLAAMPVPERRFHLRMLTAWLHEQLDQDEGVILSLQRAHRETAQEFRYNPLAQQLVGRLLHHARATHQREVVELAEHAGML